MSPKPDKEPPVFVRDNCFINFLPVCNWDDNDHFVPLFRYQQQRLLQAGNKDDLAGVNTALEEVVGVCGFSQRKPPGDSRMEFALGQ
jgi:hypothetical protein